MRKIINSTYMSLDGDIANLDDWHFAYFGEEAKQTATDQLFACDALIMGRATYDLFAESWAKRAGTDAFADRMNSIKKYVVSSTLQNPEWNNTEIVFGDVLAQVRRIKELPGADILQYGFGDVTRLLLANGLLDELRLWLHPVLSGKAGPADLLHRQGPAAHFAFQGAEVLSTGIVVLTYLPRPVERTAPEVTEAAWRGAGHVGAAAPGPEPL